MYIHIILTHLSLWTFTSSAETSCRDRGRPISTEERDDYAIVDVILNQKLILQCHYCDERDDAQPRNWYKIDTLGMSQAHEVQLSMENDMKLDRVWVNTEHSLIINNFSEADAGLYSCRALEQQNNDEKFNYLVDLVFEHNTTEIESGNVTAWAKYHDDYFAPINRLFAESKGPEFVYLRDHLKVSLEMITQWDIWGACEVCGRPNNEGIKKKRGYCRLKLTSNARQNTTDKPDEMYLLNANAVSCKSMRLYKLFPGISNMTSVVPDFVEQQKCEGTCSPDSVVGWKVGKSKGFKYRKTYVVSAETHLTLICPESSLDNKVIWKKVGKELKPGDASNPHVVVDMFSTLYLIDVTGAEEGNYTCQVDDIKMQQVVVYVYSKSRLLTSELSRHMMYLGFILSLTGSCYCAGLIITCHRRRNFKSYEELIREHPEDLDEFEGLL